jgi:DNA-binding response OmpR family regulator
MNTGTLDLDRSQMRILVVDDEAFIRQALLRAINLAGYHVEAASSGLEALELLKCTPFDLMVLDICMPEMSGVDVLRLTRQVHPDLLIIILTGHATLESAIAAVKGDAVDYLLKPASVHDIVATITAALHARAEQLRRQHLLRLMDEVIEALHSTEKLMPKQATTPEHILQIGALTLDRHKRQVVLAGDSPHTINLTEGEATVLASLMEHPNQVVSCRQLACALWGYELDDYSASDLVRPYVFRLRQKVETVPNNPRLISTIRGRGYSLALTNAG